MRVTIYFLGLKDFPFQFYASIIFRIEVKKTVVPLLVVGSELLVELEIFSKGLVP